jgi:hypothetical protein
MGTKVYCGEHVDWGAVAVKVVLTASMEAQGMPGKRSAAAKETQVLQRLAAVAGTGSDNVIKYRCVEGTPGRVFIGMELCLCSLFDVVVRPVSAPTLVGRPTVRVPVRVWEPGAGQERRPERAGAAAAVAAARCLAAGCGARPWARRCGSRRKPAALPAQQHAAARRRPGQRRRRWAVRRRNYFERLFPWLLVPVWRAAQSL